MTDQECDEVVNVAWLKFLRILSPESRQTIENKKAAKEVFGSGFALGVQWQITENLRRKGIIE
jgi:hypothetical protein